MKLTTVKIWEMDSWSGRDLLRELEFKCPIEAAEYVRKHNSKNTGPTPEYYTYAELA